MDHVSTINGRIASRARLWVSIYCNEQGLSETLYNNNICTSEDFESFCLGFNQAAPLFSIIDVGPGKEAADAKIKGEVFVNEVYTSQAALINAFFQNICGSSHLFLRLLCCILAVRLSTVLRSTLIFRAQEVMIMAIPPLFTPCRQRASSTRSYYCTVIRSSHTSCSI